MDEFRGYISTNIKNVIDYDVAEIVFHGTTEYDKSEKQIGYSKEALVC